jgi:ubiquinone/menaquinone biosynthesis C-methylase UbiE
VTTWTVGLMVACSSPATEPTAPPTVEPAANEPEPAANEPEPAANEPEPEPTSDEAAGGHGVLHDDLNARYEQQTDIKKWQHSFERSDREVADKRDRIVAQLRLEPGMAVADVGAGTGLFTFTLAEAVGPSGRVFAVDVQDYFLEHLAKTARAKQLDNVRTIAATQRSPRLAEGSIDLAFFCDAYHHIEHPAPYLREIFAAVRPGGRLVIVDYAKDDSASAFIHGHLRGTPQDFRAEIEAAGFRFQRAWDGLEENFMYVFTRP